MRKRKVRTFGEPDFTKRAVGPDAPADLKALVSDTINGSMRAGKSDVEATEQALAAARNAGWEYDGSGWTRGTPRARTFAERVTDRFSTYRMPQVEVMAPGTWKGKAYTTDDLRGIADRTNKILDRLQPPLIFEHPENAKPAKRGASLGWPERFSVEDDGKLYATGIGSILEPVANLIEQRAFKRVSVGLRDYKDAETGETYHDVIDHIGLLGAKKPEIDVMKDVPSRLIPEGLKLAASVEDEACSVTVLFATPTESGDEEEVMPDEVKPTPPESKQPDQVAALLAEVSSLKASTDAQNAELKAALKAAREETERIKAEREEEKAQARRLEAKNTVAGYVKEGRLAPSEKEEAERLAVALAEADQAVVVTFSEGDKEIKRSLFDQFRAFMAKRGKVVTFSESAPMPRSLRRTQDADSPQAKLIKAAEDAYEKGELDVVIGEATDRDALEDNG